ncbi:MAG TPA: glutaminase A [Bryobacteraceae bacterium]|nr:glutaminase A [Bryobacteraceae bacterium]
MSATPERQKILGRAVSGEAARIQEVLDATYEKYRHVDDGAVATYIPELGKADPQHFGICLATVDGHIFRAGDCDQEFTIQSMCKPFAFQMALEQHGVAETLKYVGVEPSGDAFNSIELDPKTTRPFNPMINAGAIAIASLIRKSPVEAGVQAYLDKMSDAAGRNLRIDWAVLQSETLTGNRNRAIAYLMRNFGIIDEHVNESLHQYFAQCSTLVTCQDMAVMAATLANMGTNPLTGKRVFAFQYIKYVLTVMLTCGLYDYAGGWAYEVGLPAKSGVGGGIFGVVNRQLGISVYSPKLDAQGNSVRGILTCKELASHFGLHAFEFTNVGSSFMQWLL